jgi:uncharacterized membrane protein YbhN (UPF0104 family)
MIPEDNSSNSQPRNVAKLGLEILKWIILGAIIIWIAKKVPQRDWDILIHQPKIWSFLALALALVILSNIITFWRWKQLLDALEVPISIVEVVRIGFLGVALSLVSVGSVGGDVFKAIAAANRCRHRKTEIFTSVLVDRAIGLLGLVMVAAVALSLSNSLSPQLLAIRTAAWSLSGIGIFGLLAISLLGTRFPTAWIQRIPLAGPLLHRIVQACMIFRSHRLLALSMVLSSLMVHTLATLACWFVSMGLYQRNAPRSIPTVLEHFQAIPPALAASTLPLTRSGNARTLDRCPLPTNTNRIPGILRIGDGYHVSGYPCTRGRDRWSNLPY